MSEPACDLITAVRELHARAVVGHGSPPLSLPAATLGTDEARDGGWSLKRLPGGGEPFRLSGGTVPGPGGPCPGRGEGEPLERRNFSISPAWPRAALAAGSSCDHLTLAAMDARRLR